MTIVKNKRKISTLEYENTYEIMYNEIIAKTGNVPKRKRKIVLGGLYHEIASLCVDIYEIQSVLKLDKDLERKIKIENIKKVIEKLLGLEKYFVFLRFSDFLNTKEAKSLIKSVNNELVVLYATRDSIMKDKYIQDISPDDTKRVFINTSLLIDFVENDSSSRKSFRRKIMPKYLNVLYDYIGIICTSYVNANVKQTKIEFEGQEVRIINALVDITYNCLKFYITTNMNPIEKLDYIETAIQKVTSIEHYLATDINQKALAENILKILINDHKEIVDNLKSERSKLASSCEFRHFKDLKNEADKKEEE